MEDRKQIVGYLGALVIALLLIGIIFTAGSNKKNKKSLNNEKLVSEKLLSEKLTGEKELAKLRTDFNTLKLRSDENAQLLAETNLKIAEYERRISSVSNENRSLRNVKKELDDLKITKAELEKESSQLKRDYDKLLAQNKDLQNSLTAVQNEMKTLALQMERLKSRNLDNMLVTATRGKKAEKIVISAARTKKLNMAFEVPNSLTESVSFKIVTPGGAILNSDDKTLSWHFEQDDHQFTASLSSMTGEFEQSKKVVVNYAPKGKLTKGEYKIQVFSKDECIGNCRIMLK
jgi:myosin heavy subunit